MDMPITRGAAYLLRNRTTHSWYGDGPMSTSCPAPRTLEDHIRRSHASQQTSSGSRPAARRQPQPGGGNQSSSGADVVDRAAAGDTSRSYNRGPSGYLPSSSASSPGATPSSRFPGVWESGREGAAPRNHRRRRTTQLDLEPFRPPSAYSYDGGLFVTANNHGKDFFVINPEWVSEVESVKKHFSGAEVERVMHPGGGKDDGDGAGSGSDPKVITWKSYASQRSKSAPPARFRNPITWVDPK